MDGCCWSVYVQSHALDNVHYNYADSACQVLAGAVHLGA